jgi:hypothetical protein
MVEKAAHFMVARKQGERGKARVPISPSRAHF